MSGDYKFTTKTSCQLDELQVDADYEISVRAYTPQSRGRWCAVTYKAIEKRKFHIVTPSTPCFGFFTSSSLSYVLILRPDSLLIYPCAISYLFIYLLTSVYVLCCVYGRDSSQCQRLRDYRDGTYDIVTKLSDVANSSGVHDLRNHSGWHDY